MRCQVRVGRSGDTEPGAAVGGGGVAADEDQHRVVGEEADGGFVGLAGDVELRDELVEQAVGGAVQGDLGFALARRGGAAR